MSDIEQLAKARDAVRWLLDHPNGLVDMHGLAYWATRVEHLRDRVRASL